MPCGGRCARSGLSLSSESDDYLAAGFSGAFPVGGSFSRSSLNRLAGATSAWAGAITGAFVLLAAMVGVYLLPLRHPVPVARQLADDLEEQELMLLSKDEVQKALKAGEFKLLPWMGIVALARKLLVFPEDDTLVLATPTNVALTFLRGVSDTMPMTSIPETWIGTVVFGFGPGVTIPPGFAYHGFTTL